MQPRTGRAFTLVELLVVIAKHMMMYMKKIQTQFINLGLG